MPLYVITYLCTICCKKSLQNARFVVNFYHIYHKFMGMIAHKLLLFGVVLFECALMIKIDTRAHLMLKYSANEGFAFHVTPCNSNNI